MKAKKQASLEAMDEGEQFVQTKQRSASTRRD